MVDDDGDNPRKGSISKARLDVLKMVGRCSDGSEGTNCYCMVPEISASKNAPSLSDSISTNYFSHLACSLESAKDLIPDYEVAQKVGPANIFINLIRSEEVVRPHGCGPGIQNGPNVNIDPSYEVEEAQSKHFSLQLQGKTAKEILEDNVKVSFDK